jgi:3-isopropylmalate dehydratase small subunit
VIECSYPPIIVLFRERAPEAMLEARKRMLILGLTAPYRENNCLRNQMLPPVLDRCETEP